MAAIILIMVLINGTPLLWAFDWLEMGNFSPERETAVTQCHRRFAESPVVLVQRLNIGLVTLGKGGETVEQTDVAADLDRRRR